MPHSPFYLFFNIVRSLAMRARNILLSNKVRHTYISVRLQGDAPLVVGGRCFSLPALAQGLSDGNVEASLLTLILDIAEAVCSQVSQYLAEHPLQCVIPHGSSVQTVGM